MIQLKRAIVVVEGFCQNGWNHHEEEEYLYPDSQYPDSQDKKREAESAQRRAIARLQLDHFARCGQSGGCGTVEYRVK